MANFDDFKEQFKFFKRQKTAENVNVAFDFEDYQCSPKEENIPFQNLGVQIPVFNLCQQNELLERKFGLLPVTTWKIYTIYQHPGFFFLLNPFTLDGQKYWIQRCLRDYSKKPNPCNLDLQHGCIKDIWNESLNGTQELTDSLFWKLRWVTFGYNHNWNTKVYCETSKTEFPEDLQQLCSYIALALGFVNYKSQAAIINYYHLDHTLNGHVDNSELDLNAPIISFSFGQSAIFLLGGTTKEVKPDAMLLRSGDIIIMAGQSRLAYHGVPRILQEKAPSIINLLESSETACDDWDSCTLYLKESRINLSVRQVLPNGCDTLS